MDIHLKETANSGSRFTFPSLPESINVKNSTNYQTFKIIGQGVIKIPKGMDSGTISWSGVFFGRSKRNEPIVKVWIATSECKKVLENWMEKGTVLNLMVTETNINYDVTISDFDYTDIGAYGNAEYTISFARYKELRVYTTDELKITAYVKKVETRPEPAQPEVRTYTVVQGDNLWKIARKFYGGTGSDWEKIYDVNKDLIEAEARKYKYKSSNNGYWIFPGAVYIIP